MLKPFSNHVLIKIIKKPEEEVKPGKLILTHTQEQPTYQVVDVGEEVKYVKPGDIVHLSNSPRTIDHNDEKFAIVDEGYILAKVV